jgi:hypothetical protein
MCIVNVYDLPLKLLVCALYTYFVSYDVTCKICVKYRYLRKSIFSETKIGENFVH